MGVHGRVCRLVSSTLCPLLLADRCVQYFSLLSLCFCSGPLIGTGPPGAVACPPWDWSIAVATQPVEVALSGCWPAVVAAGRRYPVAPNLPAATAIDAWQSSLPAGRGGCQLPPRAPPPLIGPRLGEGVGAAAAFRPSNASRAVVSRRGGGGGSTAAPDAAVCCVFFRQLWCDGLGSSCAVCLCDSPGRGSGRMTLPLGDCDGGRGGLPACRPQRVRPVPFVVNRPPLFTAVWQCPVIPS